MGSVPKTQETLVRENSKMNRRLVQLGLVFLAVVALTTLAYPWVRSFQRKQRDLDRISGCIGNMAYVRQQLQDHADRLPSDMPIATAIDMLIQSNQIDPSGLSCMCSGLGFRFRGRVGWLQGNATEHEREIVAFEPLSSHHPSVSVLVLYANGESDSIQQNALRDLLGDDAAEIP